MTAIAGIGVRIGSAAAADSNQPRFRPVSIVIAFTIWALSKGTEAFSDDRRDDPNHDAIGPGRSARPPDSACEPVR
jgi:hypothetical protein